MDQNNTPNQLPAQPLEESQPVTQSQNTILEVTTSSTQTSNKQSEVKSNNIPVNKLLFCLIIMLLIGAGIGVYVWVSIQQSANNARIDDLQNKIDELESSNKKLLSGADNSLPEDSTTDTDEDRARDTIVNKSYASEVLSAAMGVYAETGAFPLDSAVSSTTIANLNAGVMKISTNITVTNTQIVPGSDIHYKVKSGGTGVCVGYWNYTQDTTSYLFGGTAVTDNGTTCL